MNYIHKSYQNLLRIVKIKEGNLVFHAPDFKKDLLPSKNNGSAPGESPFCFVRKKLFLCTQCIPAQLLTNLPLPYFSPRLTK